MFGFFFFLFFSLALLIANIYTFKKKKYLYLFIPCMLFLPGYYGIELSESLPIISGTRIMFVVFYVYAIINRKRGLHLREIDLKRIPKEYLFLVGYFLFRTVTNLYYVTTYSSALKTIFVIVFEQLFLLIAFYLLKPSKSEIVTMIKSVVAVAVVLFVIGIFESISGFRIFDYLHIVSRTMNNLSLVRLGLLRATTTMLMPGFYGNMCVMVMPLIFYLYEETKSFIYILASALAVLATVHSGSRSDIFFMVAVVVVYLLFVLKSSKRRITFCKNAIIVTGILLIFIIGAAAVSDNLRYFYVGSGKAVLNELGFDFDLNEGAPEGTGGYGNNRNGTISRTRQFTGMYYVAGINPIFGLGSGAQARGDVQYYWHFSDGADAWRAIKVYDMGIVEIFCDEGLIGLLGICFLFIYLIIKSKNNNFYMLLIFDYLLTTLNTANMIPFLMLFVILISRNDIICDACILNTRKNR